MPTAAEPTAAEPTRATAAASAAERPGRRFGLAGQLALAMALGALLTLAVVATAWVAFRGVVSAQRGVLEEALPAVDAVQSIARLNTGIVALVDQLGAARSADEVGRLRGAGRERLDALERELQRLQRHRFDAAAAAAAGRTAREIDANLVAQADAAQRLLALRERRERLLSAQRRALGSLMTLTESLAANASSATATTIASLYSMIGRGGETERVLESLDRLVEVDLDRLERTSELQLACFRIGALLDQVEYASADLPALRRAFVTDLALLQRRLQDARDPQRRADALAQRAVLASGVAPDGLFAVQAEIQSLSARLDEARRHGQALALRLGEQNSGLLAASARAIESASGTSRVAVDRGMAGFVVAAALLFTALMGALWLILRTHLVGRLEEMESLVRALGEGRLDVAIRPGTARDPLAPMARALEALRANAAERARLAQALREHQGRLEREVQVRTAELRDSNAALAREAAEHAVARRQAEEANRAKNEFLGTLSHELRTPLAGVDGSVQLLRETALDADQRDVLRMIGYANTTLLGIVDEMLAYSRLEGGRVAVERAPFDLREAVDDMLALQGVAARAKGLALVRDIPEDVPRRVGGDRRKLNQILLNTVGNAVRYTDEGEVRVAVRSVDGAGGGAPVLRFEVADTGIGIPPEQREVVFEPFVQVAEPARRRGGTGLGLAICRRLADLLGGRIGLDSELGRGTTVWFELPFDAAQASADGAGDGDGEAETPPAAPRALEVLVVEDDEINRIVCIRHLQALGHRPTAVGDGEQALALLQEGSGFDVALIDVSLPGISGIALARELHRLDDGRLAALPVVAMSAHLSESARDAFGGAGIAAFLPKPFERRLLARTLAAVAAGAGPRCAAPADAQPAEPLLDDAFCSDEIETLGAATVADLLALFGRDADEAFTTLSRALDAGDRKTLARRAHRLASAAGNLGFARSVAQARRLERTARDGEVALSTLAGQVAGLRESCGQAAATLAARLAPDQRADASSTSR